MKKDLLEALKDPTLYADFYLRAIEKVKSVPTKQSQTPIPTGARKVPPARAEVRLTLEKTIALAKDLQALDLSLSAKFDIALRQVQLDKLLTKTTPDSQSSPSKELLEIQGYLLTAYNLVQKPKGRGEASIATWIMRAVQNPENEFLRKLFPKWIRLIETEIDQKGFNLAWKAEIPFLALMTSISIFTAGPWVSIPFFIVFELLHWYFMSSSGLSPPEIIIRSIPRMILFSFYSAIPFPIFDSYLQQIALFASTAALQVLNDLPKHRSKLRFKLSTPKWWTTYWNFALNITRTYPLATVGVIVGVAVLLEVDLTGFGTNITLLAIILFFAFPDFLFAWPTTDLIGGATNTSELFTQSSGFFNFNLSTIFGDLPNLFSLDFPDLFSDGEAAKQAGETVLAAGGAVAVAPSRKNDNLEDRDPGVNWGQNLRDEYTLEVPPKVLHYFLNQTDFEPTVSNLIRFIKTTPQGNRTVQENMPLASAVLSETLPMLDRNLQVEIIARQKKKELRHVMRGVKPSSSFIIKRGAIIRFVQVSSPLARKLQSNLRKVKGKDETAVAERLKIVFSELNIDPQADFGITDFPKFLNGIKDLKPAFWRKLAVGISHKAGVPISLDWIIYGKPVTEEISTKQTISQRFHTAWRIMALSRDELTEILKARRPDVLKVGHRYINVMLNKEFPEKEFPDHVSQNTLDRFNVFTELVSESTQHFFELAFFLFGQSSEDKLKESKTFQVRLKVYRLAAGWIQSKLKDLSNISLQTLDLWEDGNSPPLRSSLNRLVKVFNLSSADQLLTHLSTPLHKLYSGQLLVRDGESVEQYIFGTDFTQNKVIAKAISTNLIDAYVILQKVKSGPMTAEALLDWLRRSKDSKVYFNTPNEMERGLMWLSRFGFPLVMIEDQWMVTGVAKDHFYSMDYKTWPDPFRQQWEELIGNTSSKAVGARIHILYSYLNSTYRLTWADITLKGNPLWKSPEALQAMITRIVNADSKRNSYDEIAQQTSHIFGVSPEQFFRGRSRFDPLDSNTLELIRSMTSGQRVRELRYWAGKNVKEIAAESARQGVSLDIRALRNLEAGRTSRFNNAALWPLIAKSVYRSPELLVTGHENAVEAISGLKPVTEKIAMFILAVPFNLYMWRYIFQGSSGFLGEAAFLGPLSFLSSIPISPELAILSLLMTSLIPVAGFILRRIRQTSMKSLANLIPPILFAVGLALVGLILATVPDIANGQGAAELLTFDVRHNLTLLFDIQNDLSAHGLTAIEIAPGAPTVLTNLSGGFFSLAFAPGMTVPLQTGSLAQSSGLINGGILVNIRNFRSSKMANVVKALQATRLFLMFRDLPTIIRVAPAFVAGKAADIVIKRFGAVSTGATQTAQARHDTIMDLTLSPAEDAGVLKQAMAKVEGEKVLLVVARDNLGDPKFKTRVVNAIGRNVEATIVVVTDWLESRHSEILAEFSGLDNVTGKVMIIYQEKDAENKYDFEVLKEQFTGRAMILVKSALNDFWLEIDTQMDIIGSRLIRFKLVVLSL